MTTTAPRRRARLSVAALAVLAATAGTALTSGAQASAVIVDPATPVTTATGSSGSSGSPEIVRFFNSPADPTAALVTYAKINAIPSIDSGFRPHPDAPLSEPRRACPPSRCLDIRVPHPASVHITSNLVRVLLPAGYRHSTKRYPTIYLYNGAASSYNGWSRKTLLTQISKHMQAIFVMPEGGSERQLGMFSNWRDGTYQWETYHTQDVIPYIDRHFRTIPGARGAVGVSVSDIGALGYAGRHKGLFKGVLSISGLVEGSQLSGDLLPPDIGAKAGFFPVDMKRIWGDPVTQASTWASHNPSKLVPELKQAGVKLFITAGTGFYTGDSSDPIHSGYLEQLLFQGERSFLYQLATQGVPYKARISQGNIHDWPFFDQPLRWGLPQLVAAITPKK